MARIVYSMPSSDLLSNFGISCVVSAFPLAFFILFIAKDGPHADSRSAQSIPHGPTQNDEPARQLVPQEDGRPASNQRLPLCSAEMELITAASRMEAITPNDSVPAPRFLRTTPEESSQSASAADTQGEGCGSVPSQPASSAPSIAGVNPLPQGGEFCTSPSTVDFCIDPLTRMFLYHGVDMYEAYPFEAARRCTPDAAPRDEQPCKDYDPFDEIVRLPSTKRATALEKKIG